MIDKEKNEELKIEKVQKKLHPSESKKNKIIQEKKKELSMLEDPNNYTQVTVLNKSDIIKNDKQKNEKEQEIILDNIENKFLKKELVRKREEEIKKRKFSYFNKDMVEKRKEIDKTKYFFDERTVKKTFGKKIEEKPFKNENKKKLEKKSQNSTKDIKSNNRKDNDLLAVMNKPSSIVELKEQVISSKREVLSFEENKEELGIKQKKILKEFAVIIKDKPVKIIIKTFLSRNEKNYNKYKRISKSRSLYIRAFLINQGISHNRIKIETNEEKITKNWKNEVILNFIGV
ncbi:MAG: OmpA family protein [Alphaproteobacteria bacterium]